METKSNDILLQVREAMALNCAVGAMLKQDEDIKKIKIVCNILDVKLLTVETLLEWKENEEYEKFDRLVAENARTNLRNLGSLAGTGKTAEAMRLDSILEEGGGGLHG